MHIFSVYLSSHVFSVSWYHFIIFILDLLQLLQKVIKNKKENESENTAFKGDCSVQLTNLFAKFQTAALLGHFKGLCCLLSHFQWLLTGDGECRMLHQVCGHPSLECSTSLQ